MDHATAAVLCRLFSQRHVSSVLLDGVAELFDATKRSRGYGLYFTIDLGAGAIGPIAYGTIDEAWSLPMGFLAMALASLAILPLTGLYHWSRAAMVSLPPQQNPKCENAL